MNVTEFAERVVFGTTLEDKLWVPGKLTYDSSSAVPDVSSLASPGRPAGLQMQHEPSSSVQPPSDEKLENESARGQLLHFLANHELLATELMALVLLKFPDAPHAFRQGVLVTLQEEQEHTRMYIRRMKECGVEFGSFPLSGQFWRVVEPMKSPMDFVSRLSLTFEQANLDYSLHFASVFRQIGDTTTADVLQQIYEDEIGHVQHGLHWFRQWKNQEYSDWEAYQEALEFPMSPQRGRGPRAAFNREGRVQAGLTDDFINAIEVFRQSRGRVPTVYWFDPAAESELSGEHSENVVSLMDQLGKDLELVMAAMAKQDDVVLVRRMPSSVIRKQLIDAGFELPEFIPFEDQAALANRRLHDFEPWAWTPGNHQLVQPLIASTRHPPAPWDDVTRDLYRKTWGADRLRNWLEESERRGKLPTWSTPADCAGIPIHKANDLSSALGELANRGFANAIFKQDLATSGRGQRRLDCRGPLSGEDESWLRSQFAETQKTNLTDPPLGVVEPELDRLIDLSFLWHLPRGADSANYLGWTRPSVTAGRKYTGTRLSSVLNDCDERLKQFVLADRCTRLQSIVDWLQPRISRELSARKFCGYFGVDAMVCRDAQGELKVKPLVELNPRMTMGHVALKLKKRMAPGAEGEFRIFTKAQWDKVHGDLESVSSKRTRDGRVESGVVWMGDVDGFTKLIPVLLVGQTAIDRARRASLSG